MEELNQSLFLLINADAQSPEWARLLAIFIARDLVYIIPVTIVVLFCIHGTRKASIAILLTILCACLLAQIISYGIFHPRPFMVPLGHNYLFHEAETSFPSNHGSAIFSFAFASYLWFKRWFGLLMIAVGCAIAWARVYLGVHFPFDMIGAMIVSLCSCLLVRIVWQRYQKSRDRHTRPAG